MSFAGTRDEEMWISDEDEVTECSDIAELDLSVVDYNYYRKLGFQTIGQILRHDAWFFFDQPVYSFRRFERLLRTLDEYSFRLLGCSKEEYPSVDAIIEQFRAEDRRRFNEELEKLRLEDQREQSRIRSRRYRARQKERKTQLLCAK